MNDIYHIKLISMKPLTISTKTFPEYMKYGAFDNIAYFLMTLISARKSMIDKVQPVKIPLKCCYQLLGAGDEHSLL